MAFEIEIAVRRHRVLRAKAGKFKLIGFAVIRVDRMRYFVKRGVCSTPHALFTLRL